MTRPTQPEEVDVLIVGAGPSGLMLATWLAKLRIKTRIVDKRGTKVFTGQASFGFAERLIKEGAHINEVAFWNPGETDASKIVRTKRTADNEPGTSRFPHAVLTQGRIERFMIDAMHDFNNLTVERAIIPTSLIVSPDTSLSHPITVHLRHLSEEEATPTQVGAVPNGLFRSNLMADDEADARPSTNGVAGEEEVVKAKYVVGCDGARSWVRKQLGLTLDGDSADVHWGVIDFLPLTNFPDIRLKCTVQSEKAGSILIVPRERNLVRFYVQLGSTAHGERVDRSSITPESIIAKAKAIMAPYELEAPHVDWWTVYEVGQRLSKAVTDDRERIFIAGDAFHTHSPKAGQGMNTSMMDTFVISFPLPPSTILTNFSSTSYNLGWKLAGVLKGQLSPRILKTYQTERHKVAQELIDIDYKLSRLFSGKGEKDEGNKEFKEVWNFFDGFMLKPEA
ncbi:phenol 2-monooxygenase (NADPH), partial [Phenoliferia sp. Uapishka_3]